MPSQMLMKKEFHTVMTKLMAMVATQDDIKRMVGELRTTRQRIEELTESVDKFGAAQGKDHDELVVLRARYERLATVIVQKGIATEQELGI